MININTRQIDQRPHFMLDGVIGSQNNNADAGPRPNHLTCLKRQMFNHFCLLAHVLTLFGLRDAKYQMDKCLIGGWQVKYFCNCP